MNLKSFDVTFRIKTNVLATSEHTEDEVIAIAVEKLKQIIHDEFYRNDPNSEKINPENVEQVEEYENIENENFMVDTIDFLGKKYPIRYIYDSELGCDVKIGSRDLADAYYKASDSKEEYEAVKLLDEQICYYAEDYEHMTLTDAELYKLYANE